MCDIFKHGSSNQIVELEVILHLQSNLIAIHELKILTEAWMALL